jgi:hypothetical protein
MCVAVLTAALMALGSSTASAKLPNLPGADLLPIKGMAYSPTPSDYSPCGEKSLSCPVYYGSDFFNADFPMLWDDANGGRGDLKAMADLKVNFLHLYDWDPARNHLPALNKAKQLGIRVAVPISNAYFVFGPGNTPEAIGAILRQVYVDTNDNPSKTPHPAIKMLLIANEPENTANWQAKVAQAAANVVKAEQTIGAKTLLPVSVPFSFSVYTGQNANNPDNLPAVGQQHSILAQFRSTPGLGNDFIAKRFVAATNPQNPGSDMTRFIPKFKEQVPNTLWWFSEQGQGVIDSCTGYQNCTPSEQQQAKFNADQWAATKPGASDILIGGAQFEWHNEPRAKTGNDATFGIYKYTGSDSRTATNKDGTYRVDNLIKKPSWTSLRNAFAGKGNAGVARKGSTLVYTAGDGQANDVTVDKSADAFSFTDDAVLLDAGEGCASGADDHEVQCDATGVTRIRIETGDGSDRVVNETNVPVAIDTGSGNDRVVTRGGGNDTVDCGKGTDKVAGDEKDDADHSCEQVSG